MRDLILYYNRKPVPTRPSLEKLIKNNSDLKEPFPLDDIFDAYNMKVQDYEQEYEKNKDITENMTCQVMIRDDGDFMTKIKKIEKMDIFISWSDDSKDLIEKRRYYKK